MNYIYDPDIGDDFLRWARICERVNLNSSSELEELQEEIIKNKDAGLAYFFSCDFNYQLYKMQNIILEIKNPKYCFLFAKNIINADVKALQNIILNSKNLKYITKLGCYVKNVNLKKIQTYLLKSNKKK